MRKYFMMAAPVALAIAALTAAATAEDANPAVQGVWRAVEVTVTTSDSSFTNEIRQPNLLIFTERHYSSVRVFGDAPRPKLPDEPTDAQLLAAWRAFFANAGTYEVSGDEITTKVIVAKSPNTTSDRAENTSGFERDGDVLYRLFTSQTSGNRFRVKFEKVE